jgi:thiol-disulfide isomerase/thioredoxin
MLPKATAFSLNLLLLLSMTSCAWSFSHASIRSLRKPVGQRISFSEHRHVAPNSGQSLETSVTGQVYSASEDVPDAPFVRLFTKHGCTLCDTVKDILHQVKTEYPHSLEQVDITDVEFSYYWDRYKYDIPVLHINGLYWIKHRITIKEAIGGFAAVRAGTFQSPPGEPSASRMERS